LQGKIAVIYWRPNKNRVLDGSMNALTDIDIIRGGHD